MTDDAPRHPGKSPLRSLSGLHGQDINVPQTPRHDGSDDLPVPVPRPPRGARHVARPRLPQLPPGSRPTTSANVPTHRIRAEASMSRGQRINLPELVHGMPVGQYTLPTVALDAYPTYQRRRPAQAVALAGQSRGSTRSTRAATTEAQDGVFWACSGSTSPDVPRPARPYGFTSGSASDRQKHIASTSRLRAARCNAGRVERWQRARHDSPRADTCQRRAARGGISPLPAKSGRTTGESFSHCRKCGIFGGQASHER
jgi:hypothetical protein